MRWGLANTNGTDYSLTNLFDDFLNVPVEFIGNDLNPRVDVQEDEKAVYVKAEIPGLDEKDLNVTLHNTMLTISGEKKAEKKEEGKDRNYYYCERSFGSFSRTIELPEGIKADGVKAHYKNGVLEIELAKDEKAQPKKITIDVN
ncbi:MAG TPA: Hsp20/alpha crystallin family protein [Spirochaetota bacterium]|nr:Hsp20/alpha crystallin family protein [Spirochaetota bacterium]HOD13928.1 Hsp20/alpha crystallin family protein [Spirochaetota bacterium]HPG49790.1 Hsp20/alpha crystallin family protein [Spirochaetota bacterium]HPN11226.1 Hsp20/alpha crystallin family protein [Spirochaetota bacterium]HQL81704.1 Hsp20/alpha crystallin family protein [Spirochaetota bacterium]